MKQFVILVLISALTGCATPNLLVKKEVELVQTPVPFCPAPPTFVLPKQAGIDMITPQTPPGDVAKMWNYEATYWKSLSNIQQAIIDMYKTNSVNLDKLNGDLSKMIDATNAKLKQTTPTAPQ